MPGKKFEYESFPGNENQETSFDTIKGIICTKKFLVLSITLLAVAAGIITIVTVSKTRNNHHDSNNSEPDVVFLEKSLLRTYERELQIPSDNSSSSNNTLPGDVLVDRRSHNNILNLRDCCEPKDGKCEGFTQFQGLPLPECFTPEFYLFNSMRGTTFDSRVNISSQNIPSEFRPVKTVFIVHGFNDYPTSKSGKQWMIRLMQNLIQRFKDGVNVILTDWHLNSNGSGITLSGDYKWAVSNTRMAGKSIHDLTKELLTKGLSPADTHCIGHSLGAHVCGFAGKYLGPQKFGRISGLDPAGPEFKDRDNTERLYTTDADYVDVIHTDSKGTYPFGLMENLGHVDFYPNGGVQQTGCFTRKRGEENTSSTNTSTAIGGKRDFISEFVGCSHDRARDLYVASILSAKCYATKTCSTFNSVSAKQCTGTCDQCQQMGYDSILHRDNQGLFYLKTSSKYPYCTT